MLRYNYADLRLLTLEADASTIQQHVEHITYSAVQCSCHLVHELVLM